ncbi:hypothetical protein MTO96_022110 [Rhipicephalus appendiculatus]
MLSDAEETLTDTDKAGAVGSSTDPNAASLPVTEHKNDPQFGEGMDEDSNASTIVTHTAEEDAYNGACWKVARTKRRARNAAALEAASPLTTDLKNPLTKPRPSVAKRLPSLPFRDEKVVLRPLGGLRLEQWPRPTLATALWAAAGVSPHDRRNIILRTRPEQNLAVISTPSSHVADALLKVQELLLGQRTYPVSAYLAAPRRFVQGYCSGTGTRYPVTYARRRNASDWHPDTTGSDDGSDEYCTGHLRRPSRATLRPLSWSRATLLPPIAPDSRSAKRASNWDTERTIAPTPDMKVCEQCGIDNPMPLHACSPQCKSCGGDHATTAPQCPRRQRQPFNRSWVKKAIDEEQRQMTESTNAAPPSATTDASVTPLKKSDRSRSKKRSTSRCKARTKSKSRSRPRSQSTSARIQEKRPTIPASQASPSPYKKAL